jgi:hypothetical protein
MVDSPWWVVIITSDLASSIRLRFLSIDLRALAIVAAVCAFSIFLFLL